VIFLKLSKYLSVNASSHILRREKNFQPSAALFSQSCLTAANIQRNGFAGEEINSAAPAKTATLKKLTV
jgi:hypothetical protein